MSQPQQQQQQHQQGQQQQTTTRRQRIRVPTRMVQGGFDFKFDTDSYDVKLYDILSPEEYSDIVQQINQKIKPARSNQIDGMLLMTGPLLVPLALWGARHSLQTRKRKRLLKEAIDEFNTNYPDHYMRWNRGGPESFLSIERRTATPTAAATAVHAPQQQQQQALVLASPIPTNNANANGTTTQWWLQNNNKNINAEAKLL